MRMSDLKDRRQRAIADLIRDTALSSQEELADRLGSLGFAVTQATISRDLEQIGAVKVRLREGVSSVEPAANLVVIKTPPGSAQVVGFALDNAGVPECVGTICGDDTIFVACRSGADARALTVKLSRELP